VQAFESGKEKWPCKRTPRPRCKCGILARRGVVRTELGYGWFCGNLYGDFIINLNRISNFTQKNSITSSPQCASHVSCHSAAHYKPFVGGDTAGAVPSTFKKKSKITFFFKTISTDTMKGPKVHMKKYHT